MYKKEIYLDSYINLLSSEGFGEVIEKVQY